VPLYSTSPRWGLSQQSASRAKHVGVVGFPVVRSPKWCIIESTLMLPRVTRAAETLESGFQSVGLQPTDDNHGFETICGGVLSAGYPYLGVATASFFLGINT
jgi:hypothetical protein